MRDPPNTYIGLYFARTHSLHKDGEGRLLPPSSAAAAPLSLPLPGRALTAALPSRSNRLQDGWLFKQSGGKSTKSFGNALGKWDKRWFVLRGGSTMLYYYKVRAGSP